MDSEWDDSIEILILGDSSVGKTTFLAGQHQKNHPVTTSVKITKMIFDDFKCKFYDTPGKKRYQSDIKRQLDQHQRQYPYQIVIYMFSYDNPQSLENLKIWKNKFLLTNVAQTILIANKCELQKKFSEVQYEKVKQQIRPNAQYHSSINIEKESKKYSFNVLSDLIRNFIQQEDAKSISSQDNLAIYQQIDKSQILSNSIISVKSKPQFQQIKHEKDNQTHKRPRPSQGDYQNKWGEKKIKPWYKRLFF